MRILRGLSSRLLSCGCMAGIYETYNGQVVTLLDARHPGCTNGGHEQGLPVPELAGVPRSSEVTLQPERQRKS
jgi:hypothetical protein